MIPANVPIKVWRNARYTEEFNFTVDDLPYDLTGWVGRLQARLYGAQEGAALIDLGSVTSDSEGVWIIDAEGGSVQVRIDEDTLIGVWTALGGPAEAGDPIELSYDLVMTPPEGGDEVWAEGIFTINPGVTV